ncbi:MAG: adenosylcobinamide-GDP ribazoletransferase [Nitrososphaerales archaeon]|nr:adenosylcobinamide-GDP ribazoletransferase [Nitrososphaerales archaeon]
MGVVRGFKSLIAFFTTIPVKSDDKSLIDAANYMPLSPIIGILLGLSSGLFGWFIHFFLPSSIVGVLTLAILLMITGLHHTDGLVDFADGVMCQGTPERKIEAMRNGRTGVAGLSLGFITLMTTSLTIAYIPQHLIVQSMIVAENLAKAGMTFLVWMGRSAAPGINTYFVEMMHKNHRLLRLIIPLTISFVVSFALLSLIGMVAWIAGLITSLVILKISNRHFKGITGDVCGATNELTRMVSLLMILVFIV